MMSSFCIYKKFQVSRYIRTRNHCPRILIDGKKKKNMLTIQVLGKKKEITFFIILEFKESTYL